MRQRYDAFLMLVKDLKFELGKRDSANNVVRYIREHCRGCSASYVAPIGKQAIICPACGSETVKVQNLHIETV